MNHRISKSNYKTILSLFISALTITILSSNYTTPTHADTSASSSSSANASITVSNTINLTLTGGDLVINNLTPGSASDSNIITATITSNSPYGYHLSATTGTSSGATSLVNTADSNFVFTNLNANKASLSNFSDNTWGYSYSTDNGTTWISGDYGTALSGYNGLTLDNDDSGATGTTLYNNDSYAGSTAVKFKIGAKSATTQATGTYTGTVNFYAVTNPESAITIANATTMQEVEACPVNLPEEVVYTIKDSRDNQSYKVAKLKDGKCWMVENLNLAGGTKLSSDTTDFESNYTLPNNQGWKSDGSLPDSSTTGFNTPNYANVYNSEQKTNCGAGGQDAPCYSYYSWDAATLGSGRTLATDNEDAPYSICPKGWKLPTSRTVDAADWQTASDFYALAHQYGLDSSTSVYESDDDFYAQAGPGTVPNFLLSGYYHNSARDNIGHVGIYWSSTSSSSIYYSYALDFTGSDVDTNSRQYSIGRTGGYSVRCLFSGQ